MSEEQKIRLRLYIDLLKALVRSKSEQHRLGFRETDLPYFEILFTLLEEALNGA
jgi:hypothetical protein